MDYVMIQGFVLQNGREGKMGKINDKMENITSGWFLHDISMVLRNNEISCFTHKPLKA